MGVTFSEAARQLGRKSRSVLYRLRDSGRLEGYLTANGSLELAPPGLPTLTEHLEAVIQPQRRAGSAQSGDRLDRGQIEAELSAERTRKLRMENDLAEGKLVVAAVMEQALFAAGRQARDTLLRLPLQLSHEAVVLGLPLDHRFELEQRALAIVTAALVALAQSPLGEPVARS